MKPHRGSGPIKWVLILALTACILVSAQALRYATPLGWPLIILLAIPAGLVLLLLCLYLAEHS